MHFAYQAETLNPELNFAFLPPEEMHRNFGNFNSLTAVLDSWTAVLDSLCTS